MISFKSNFNTIYVIESIPSDERKTGRELFDDTLTRIEKKTPGLTVKYHDPETPHELFNVLSVVQNAAAKNMEKPLIHFVCHGNKQGLATANKQFIPWDTLKDALKNINYACNMNLIVVAAACCGGHLIKTAQITNRSPFSAVIGTEGIVYNTSVLRDYAAFYTAFFKHGSESALDVLNISTTGPDEIYHLFTAIDLFRRGFSDYKYNHLTGAAFEKRVDNLAKDTNLSSKIPDFESRVTHIREELLNGAPEVFEKYKRLFFMIDQYPQNANRFLLEYDMM